MSRTDDPYNAVTSRDPIQASPMKLTIGRLVRWPLLLGLFVPVISLGRMSSAAPQVVNGEETHWALRPVTRPQVPAVVHANWPRNAIDRFILARLEPADLPHAPEADRRTLIRRLAMNLTGLPPTPEEVESYVRDPSSDAYERLVDRYLISPAYGERWARHWLDVVRFAESDGFETNLHRPGAWPYRDYVIGAFNDDKPYDRFVTEQLAGDVLAADAATGFLVAGAYDKVKSPDPVLTLQQRADELHDIVGTIGSTFLGLTIGCARCHDHKFDPISQTDYYALTAVFAGVRHGERTVESADATKERLARAAALRRELSEVESASDAAEPLADTSPPVNHRGQIAGRRPPVNARRNVERFAPVTAKFVRFTVLATNNLEPCIDELEVFAAGPEPRNVALASLGTKATASGTYPNSDIHKLEHVNDARYGNGRSWISNEPGKGWVQLELAEPVRIDRIVWGRDREQKYKDRLATRYRIEVAAEPGAWTVVASSDDRQPLGTATRETSRRADLERRLREAERPPAFYLGTFAAPEPTHRLHRGDPMQKRAAVAPAGPERVGPRLQLPAETPERDRRLALARWLTDPANPLPARVMVNRLWHYHFGRGLVDTPSDFGRRGSRPTHPELLDWLAADDCR